MISFIIVLSSIRSRYLSQHCLFHTRDIKLIKKKYCTAKSENVAATHAQLCICALYYYLMRLSPAVVLHHCVNYAISNQLPYEGTLHLHVIDPSVELLY